MSELVFGTSTSGDQVAECELEPVREDGRWTGLCAIDAANRAIDGPGFAGRPRTAEAVQRLVRGACAHLGAGPVTVETWGEPAGPYLALGFDPAEDGGGWELVLDAKP